MAKNIIKGRKGGSSSPRTPTESPDDLQSVAKAKVLLALGEGEFGGELDGTRIFLNGTPISNPDGSKNFSGVIWEFRAGTQAQSYIQGMPGTENEVAVTTPLTTDNPWVHSFSNAQLSAARLRLKWSSLYQQESDGDINGYNVNYAIDLQTNGGTWQEVINESVNGKTTTGYERSRRIDLPQGASSWTLRARRITPDSTSSLIGDKMTVESYTEVIDAKLRYPNTALLYIEFDSSQFNGSIPQISCEPKGRVVRIPANYDPLTRSYSGTWTGAFKWAWTDNPAWVFYDIVVSDRFGLGQRLTADNIDKWELYRVAQYCDQPVPDGRGGSGTEPRYICNVYVQDRNDAYSVLRDFAAIFRGMTYWGNNQLIALADMPRDIDYNYTRANTINGLFTYSSSTTKARYTTALVSWSDPANEYNDAMEPVFEQDLVMRYGTNQLELTAIGCTRQSEANRKGRWGILTNNKDRVVTFSVGLDGMIPLPGYIITVADELLSGKVVGGRINSVNGRSVQLDRPPDAVAGDRLIVNLPSGASQSRTIQSVTENIVTVTTAFTVPPESESVWVVESDTLYAQQYRIIGVTDNNNNTYTITGSFHDPDKYARIDTGAVIDDRPVSVIPPGTQKVPNNIVIDSFSVVQQNISTETMRCSWSQSENAISYEAQWRRNDSNWVSVPRSSTTSFDVPGVYSGRYLVRVRAINAAEISSGWGYSEEKILTGKVGNPPKPVGFTATDNVVFGINLSWGFPANTDDTLKTEIQYSTTAKGDNPLLLADVPYPQRNYQQMGLKIGVIFWYRAQLVDKTGNESGYTDWVMGQSSADVSDITESVLEDMKHSDVFKDLIENSVDSNEKIAGMADDIKKNADEIEQQAQDILKNADGLAEAAVKIDEISVSMDGMSGGVKNSSIAVIQNGLAQVISRRSQTATNSGNTASIDRVDTTMASASEAVARALITLDASAGSNIANATDLTETLADFTHASATNINSLTVSVNDQTAAITQTAKAVADIDGNISAMYNIKVGVASNGQNYAAGMGIGVENTPNGMQSQVIFLADRFAVTSQAGGNVSVPFVIENGQTVIDDAFIRLASIDTAKIKDAAITNAKIGGDIWSEDFAAGSSGWKIARGGGAEFNNIKIRGDGEFYGTVYAEKIVGDVGDFLVNASEMKELKVGNSGSLTGTLCVFSRPPRTATKVCLIGALNSVTDSIPALQVNNGFFFNSLISAGSTGAGSYIRLMLGNTEIFRTYETSTALQAIQFTVPVGAGTVALTYEVRNETNGSATCHFRARYHVFTSRNVPVISRT